MKKLSFYLMALVGLISTSCNQDEPVAPLAEATSNLIGYAVTADNGSRSATSYTNGTDISTIKVSAWITAPSTEPFVLPDYGSQNTGNGPYFTNDVLTRGGESGTTGVFSYTSDARFWPQNDETLDFFAVVDEDQLTDTIGNTVSFSWDGGTSGKPGLGWIAQKKASEMPDLLYAYTRGQKWSGIRGGSQTGKYQQNVSFDFNHAFAKVIIKAEVLNKNIHVVISDVKLRGIISKGRFTFPHEINKRELTPATWEAGKCFTKIDCPLADDVILEKSSGRTTLVGVNNDDALMVIPNSYSGRNGGNKVQTYIELTAVAYNIAGDSFNEETDAVIYGTAEGKPCRMCVPVEFSWKMGTINTYTIIFDCNNGGTTPPPTPEPDPENPDPNDPDPEPYQPSLIRIGYEVEVSPWVDGENKFLDYPQKASDDDPAPNEGDDNGDGEDEEGTENGAGGENGGKNGTDE